jgi:hypothetical protein
MTTHDGVVTTTALPPEPERSACGPRAATTGRCPGLEEFWPSRRGYAYDEFCR